MKRSQRRASNLWWKELFCSWLPIQLSEWPHMFSPLQQIWAATTKFERTSIYGPKVQLSFTGGQVPPVMSHTANSRSLPIASRLVFIVMKGIQDTNRFPSKFTPDATSKFLWIHVLASLRATLGEIWAIAVNATQASSLLQSPVQASYDGKGKPSQSCTNKQKNESNTVNNLTLSWCRTL